MERIFGACAGCRKECFNDCVSLVTTDNPAVRLILCPECIESLKTDGTLEHIAQTEYRVKKPFNCVSSNVLVRFYVEPFTAYITLRAQGKSYWLKILIHGPGTYRTTRAEDASKALYNHGTRATATIRDIIDMETGESLQRVTLMRDDTYYVGDGYNGQIRLWKVDPWPRLSQRTFLYRDYNEYGQHTLTMRRLNGGTVRIWVNTAGEFRYHLAGLYLIYRRYFQTNDFAPRTHAVWVRGDRTVAVDSFRGNRRNGRNRRWDPSGQLTFDVIYNLNGDIASGKTYDRHTGEVTHIQFGVPDRTYRKDGSLVVHEEPSCCTIH